MTIYALLLWLGGLPSFSQLDGAREPRVRVEEVGPVLRAHAVSPSEVLFQDEFQQEPAAGARYHRVVWHGGVLAWVANRGMGVSGAMQANMRPTGHRAGGLMVLFGRNPYGTGQEVAEIFGEIWWRIYLRHESRAAEQFNVGSLACLTDRGGSRCLEASVALGPGGTVHIVASTAGGPRRSGSGRKVATPAPARKRGRQGRTPILCPREAGRWICVESHVRLNDPGQENGEFNVWVDGRLECSLTGLNWREGGNPFGINSLTLGNALAGGSPGRLSLWLDNLVVARAVIGPVVVTRRCWAIRTAVNVDAWQVQVGGAHDAREALWSSPPLQGSQERCAIQAPMEVGGVYWLRTRDRVGRGGWSRWSAWHSPFAIR